MKSHNAKFHNDSTVWKFHDFSVTPILREINFGGSRSSKTDVFATLGVPKIIILENFSLQNMQKISKNHNSELLNV